MTDEEKLDRVAEAIYMTHWKPADPATGRGSAPRWENVSDAVREWILAQARNAMKVMAARAGE